jgi:hypothetical protein
VQNNYLTQGELRQRRAELAKCLGDECKQIRTKYEKISQARNEQIEIACLASPTQCHSNALELQRDVAQLGADLDSLTRGQERIDASNNLKQALVQYQNHLEELANIGEKALGRPNVHPDILAAQGYLTADEAEHLKGMRLGTAITVGAIVVPTAGVAIARAASVAASALTRALNTYLGNTVRVYRVEGAPNTRVLIGENGRVAIQGDQMLFLNFGSQARAEEFFAVRQAQVMPGAAIKSFDVPRSVLDDLRRSAVPEAEAAFNRGRPLIVDPTKAPDQFGLRADQIKQLQQSIIQGTGRSGPR